MKKKQIASADIVKDSEDLGDTNFSSGDDDDTVIRLKRIYNF
jgi:hypothetical protein